MSKTQKSYFKLGMTFVICCVVGWAGFAGALGTSVAQAQWRPAAEQTGFAAWGTVLVKEPALTYMERKKKDAPESWGGIGFGGSPRYEGNTRYIYVKFKTDGGVTFVIPFRYTDIEAIPVSVEAEDIDTPARAATKEHVIKAVDHTQATSCYWDGSESHCFQPPTDTVIPAQPAVAATHKHIDAVVAHGILKYHLCDGPFYCFDSWEDK